MESTPEKEWKRELDREGETREGRGGERKREADDRRGALEDLGSAKFGGYKLKPACSIMMQYSCRRGSTAGPPPPQIKFRQSSFSPSSV